MEIRIGPAQVRAARRLYLTALLSLLAALVFEIFVEMSKQIRVIEHVSPFANDPYDAVVSFTVQIVLVVALLTGLRLVALWSGSRIRANAPRLIFNGCLVIWASIVITLLVDAQAEAGKSSRGVSAGGTFLVVALIVQGVVALLLGGALIWSWRLWPAGVEKERETDGGDALTEFLLLIGILLEVLARYIPGLGTALRWLEGRFQGGVPGGIVRSLRANLWLFCLLIALLGGVGIAGSHYFLEGGAPTLLQTLKIALFFFSVEAAAIVLCFLLLGGLLGLRPPLIKRR